MGEYTNMIFCNYFENGYCTFFGHDCTEKNEYEASKCHGYTISDEDEED